MAVIRMDGDDQDAIANIEQKIMDRVIRTNSKRSVVGNQQLKSSFNADNNTNYQRFKPVPKKRRITTRSNDKDSSL